MAKYRIEGSELAPLVLTKTDFEYLGQTEVIRLIQKNKFRGYVVWGQLGIGLHEVPVDPYVEAFFDTINRTPEALLALWKKLYATLNIPWMNFQNGEKAYQALRNFGVTTGADLCTAGSSGSVQKVQAA